MYKDSIVEELCSLPTLDLLMHTPSVHTPSVRRCSCALVDIAKQHYLARNHNAMKIKKRANGKSTSSPIGVVTAPQLALTGDAVGSRYAHSTSFSIGT